MASPKNRIKVVFQKLYQLLRRAYLCGEALELLGRRILVISLLAWLPLLVLSMWAEQTLEGERQRTVSVGRGGARPLSGGTTAADPGGTGGPQANASAGAAIPGAPSSSGARATPVVRKNYDPIVTPPSP
jgi:hypothetical protein